MPPTRGASTSVHRHAALRRSDMARRVRLAEVSRRHLNRAAITDSVGRTITVQPPGGGLERGNSGAMRSRIACGQPEGRPPVRQGVRRSPQRDGRGHRLLGVLQPSAAASRAGRGQPHGVRRKLAPGPAQESRVTESLWIASERGKVTPSAWGWQHSTQRAAPSVGKRAGAKRSRLIRDQEIDRCHLCGIVGGRGHQRDGDRCRQPVGRIGVHCDTGPA